MAENLTIARPYAEAAFQMAKSQNALGPWQQALAGMAAIAADAQMGESIGNPRLLPTQVAQLFLDVANGGANTKLSADQQNFVRVLVDNDRLDVLSEISELFVELKNGQEGVQDARITSAFPLDEVMLKNLVAELEVRFKFKIQATVSVDSELIGGVTIAIGDQVIDASVRGKLAAMATALKN